MAMIQIGPAELAYVQWAIGLLVTLYAATIGLFLQARHKAEQRQEAEVKRVNERIDALEESFKEDNAQISEQLEVYRKETAGFQAKIMQDMREVATRADVHQMEQRLTQQLRDSFGRK